MILVVAEHRAGVLNRSAAELVAFARDLEQGSDATVAALVMGVDPGIGAAAEAMSALVDRVLVVRDPRMDPPRAETQTRAVSHVASEIGATIVLVPDSRAATSYGPRAAMRLGGVHVEGVTGAVLQGDELVVRRLTHLARFETTVASRAPVTVVSVAAGAVPAAERSTTTGTVREVSVPIADEDLRIEVVASETRDRGTIALDGAEVVVCGGRGVGSSQAFESVVVPLAARLGAALGVTRPVVDAGWRGYDELVGQTGRAVAPKLCITLGVSGAAHFVSGVNRARILVAVNTDPDAPIFRSADYGIVGDLREVVPALLEALPTAT